MLVYLSQLLNNAQIFSFLRFRFCPFKAYLNIHCFVKHIFPFEKQLIEAPFVSGLLYHCRSWNSGTGVARGWGDWEERRSGERVVPGSQRATREEKEVLLSWCVRESRRNYCQCTIKTWEMLEHRDISIPTWNGTKYTKHHIISHNHM